MINNDILTKQNYFLQIYELKKKFRLLLNETTGKKTIIRQLSSCVTEKFDGFYIVCMEYDKKVRRRFSPIDIIYNPGKCQN